MPGRSSSFELEMRGFLETALDAVVSADAGGFIQGWNCEARKAFGWEREDVIGLPLTTIIPKRYREAHTRGMLRFLATGHAQVLSKRIEIEGLHRDGHEFPVELTVTPVVRDERTNFVAFIRDLTQTRAAENELKELTGTLEATNRRLESLAAEDPLDSIFEPTRPRRRAL